MLLEPRISGVKADSVIKGLGFGCSHRIEVEGFSEGIWILWEEDVGISICCNNWQFVHMKVSASNCNQFMFTPLMIFMYIYI